MIETIFSAVLGFFTLPLVVLGFMAIGGTGKFIAYLELPAAGYWSGFGLFVGLAVLAGGGLGLWSTLTR